MMPPPAPAHNGGGSNRSATQRFPRAGGAPVTGGGLYLRAHGGWGESVVFDPSTGEFRSAPAMAGGLSGVYGEVNGVRVVFYRDRQHGLVLRAGDELIALDLLGAEASWERTAEGSHRLQIRVNGYPHFELRYDPVAPDVDLGLLIRDVLADPARRAGIFG